MGTLFEELKRRKVFRVAAVYAVVAWLLIQIADTVLPALQMPEWTVSFVTVLFILGFPIAVILSWAYEVTPDGIKSDSSSHLQPLVTPSRDRNLIYATFALVLLVAGFQIADRFLTDQSSASLAGNQASNSSDANTLVVRSTLPLGDLRPTSINGVVLSYGSALSLSADGARFTYTSREVNGSQIHIRDLDQLESRPLGSRVDPGLGPRLSPDGEWVFFRKDNNLWKISVSEGLTQLVTEDAEIGGTVGFGADNTVYFTGPDSILRQVPAAGGESESLGIPVVADMNRQVQPRSLPGGKALLFTRSNFGGSHRIELFDLETQEARILIEAGYWPMYSPTGHITFIREGSLWAVPFDLDNLAISGPEVLLVERIESIQNFGTASYALSGSGNLIYIPDIQLESEAELKSVLAWVDRTGAETVLDMVPQRYRYPALSPDGNRVALTIQQDLRGLNSDIWSYDLERGTLSRVTFSGIVSSSLWSIDGDRLIYGTWQGIRSVNFTGLGQVEELTNPGQIGSPILTTISPDGQQILFTQYSDSKQVNDIHILNMTPEHQSEPLMNSEFFELGAAISPDGRWLAYHGNETGRLEVYVRPYPEIEAGKWQISTEGAGYPQWSPSGNELFYRHGLGRGGGTQTLVVTIETEPDFRASSPQLLFTSDHIHDQEAYKVSTDGQRFLMLKPVVSESRNQVAMPINAVLVENFDEELKRLVPADPQ